MHTNLRRIYYDALTGEKLVEVGFFGDVTPTNIEQDVFTYKILNERNPLTYNYLELLFTEFQKDFAECIRYRVNPETKELIFEYPNPENPDEPIIPDKPLSVEIEEVKQENQLLQQSLLELTSYAAMQDERLATQEQALLELSTLFAGGGE